MPLSWPWILINCTLLLQARPLFLTYLLWHLRWASYFILFTFPTQLLSDICVGNWQYPGHESKAPTVVDWKKRTAVWNHQCVLIGLVNFCSAPFMSLPFFLAVFDFYDAVPGLVAAAIGLWDMDKARIFCHKYDLLFDQSWFPCFVKRPSDFTEVLFWATGACQFLHLLLSQASGIISNPALSKLLSSYTCRHPSCTTTSQIYR